MDPGCTLARSSSLYALGCHLCGGTVPLLRWGWSIAGVLVVGAGSGLAWLPGLGSGGGCWPEGAGSRAAECMAWRGLRAGAARPPTALRPGETRWCLPSTSMLVVEQSPQNDFHQGLYTQGVPSCLPASQALRSAGGSEPGSFHITACALECSQRCVTHHL